MSFYFYLVILMRRSMLQLLSLVLLTNSWNPVQDSSRASWNCLCFFFMLPGDFCVVVLFKSSTWRNKIAPIRL